jgi:lipoate-protein ligase B
VKSQKQITIQKINATTHNFPSKKWIIEHSALFTSGSQAHKVSAKGEQYGKERGL